MTTTDVAAGTAFYSALQSKAMDAVKDIFKSELVPVQYPAQGDFCWNWQNANGVLNDATYQYINALAGPGQVPGTVALSSGGGFANAYVAVLNAMEYALSAADQQKLNQAQSNASLQAQTIVSDYQSSFGTITDAQLSAAGTTQKVDFVIGHVLGTQWSGSTPPLTYSQMAAARNLKSILPQAPAGGDQVITDVVTYLNIMQPVNALSDELQNGAWMLSQLKANAMTPSAANGGQQTFNPSNGAVSGKYNVGWSVNTSVQSISNDLQNTSRTITISMQTEESSGSTLGVQISGEAGFTVGSWLEFSTEAKGSYDMSKAQGTSTQCSATITYAGYSMVAMAPAAWQQATNVGFFWSDPINQAVANEGQDVTGFRFVSTPPYSMGALAQGGGFGLLTNLLIANYPTVEITYTHADYHSFEQDWSESITGDLTLFGFIKLGSFSQGAYGSSVSAGSDNSTFTVKFTPSPQMVNQPQALKTAFVIAGAVENPGA